MLCFGLLGRGVVDRGDGERAFGNLALEHFGDRVDGALEWNTAREGAEGTLGLDGGVEEVASLVTDSSCDGEEAASRKIVKWMAAGESEPNLQKDREVEDLSKSNVHLVHPSNAAKRVSHGARKATSDAERTLV